MKKLLSLFVLMLSSILASTAMGQDENYSMLVDGRNWRYEHLKPDGNGRPIDGAGEGYITYQYVLKVDGDTIFDGRPCKKINWDGPKDIYWEVSEVTTPYAYGYEEDGKVMLYALYTLYAFYPAFPEKQWVTLYDFNVPKDSLCNIAAFWRKGMIVKEKGTVDKDGTVRRCIGLGYNSSTSLVYAVEGVGSSFGLFEYTNLITDGSISRFVGCYDEETCLYSADDFKNLNIKPDDNMTYRPLVEEGKHWTYDNFLPLRPAKYDHYYYYDLKGDTLIAGQQCLKMYSENKYNDNSIHYEGALYEVNKKVYCFFPENNQAELLYDFNCTVGDIIQVREGLFTVKDIRIEDNGGIAIKKYILTNEEFLDGICWVEGVGASQDFFGMLPLTGNYNTLNACELNGEKLYQMIEPDLTEEGYHKMGIEGKRWNYIHYHLEDDGWHEDPYSYVVKGDTIIRRTTYKKLYYQDEKTERFECLLLETERTVYKNTDLGNNSHDLPIMTTFFDFGRDDFGKVYSWKANMEAGNTNWMVYGVDTIEVNNRQFRRYTCLQKYSEESENLTTIEYDGEGVWHDIWVEGVGSATSGIMDQHPSHEPPIRTPGEYTAFISCYEDGKCIFTADDFNDLVNPDTANNMTYRPFVEEGKVWKVGTISGNPVQLVDYYYFDGDTIVGGKTCKQMMCKRFVSPEHPDYAVIMQFPLLRNVGAWYEEDKKVYTYDTINKQFKMVYDFSPETNDTLLIDYFYECIIGPKQTGGLIGFKGVHRDIMCCGDGAPYYNTTWLEGVGGIDGPTRNIYDETAEYVSEFLMSCAVGDEVIYLNDEFEDGATPESADARKLRFDFTHTTKLRPKAPIERENSDACISSSEREVARLKVKAPIERENSDACISSSEREVARLKVKAQKRSEEELSLYGEYNNLRLDVHLDPLDDAYQVCIADESGQAVYEKNINAGTIVGLNIDISNYPKGRYTITIENSQESFVGEFETKTTGIEEIINRKETTRHGIYNLHGQRICSLQKGLNIVNGKKVLVK